MVLVASVATEREKLLLVALLHSPPPHPSAVLQTWVGAGGLLEGPWRRKGAAAWDRVRQMGQSCTQGKVCVMRCLVSKGLGWGCKGMTEIFSYQAERDLVLP